MITMHSCALAFGACLAANFRADFRPLLALLLPPAAPGASIYHAMDAVATDEEAAFLAQLLAGGVEDRQAAYTNSSHLLPPPRQQSRMPLSIQSCVRARWTLRSTSRCALSWAS